MEIKNFIIKNSFFTFLTKIISAFFGFFTSILLARTLGPIGKGEYTLIILLPCLLIVMFDFGVSTANVYLSSKKKYPFIDLISNSIIIGFSVSVVLIFITLISLSFLQTLFFKNISLSLLRIVCFIIPFLLINNYFIGLLVGSLKINLVNIINLFQSLLLFILLFIILVFLKGNTAVAVLVWVFVQFISFVVIFYNCVKNITEKLKIRLNMMAFKDTISFGLKGYIANVSSFLNYRLDMFFISLFLNAVSVGYYAVAVNVAEIIWYIPNSLSFVFYPITSSRNEEEINRITPIISRQVSFLTFMLSLIICLFSKFIITFLFGDSFLPSIFPLVILLPGIVSLSMAKILSGYFCGIGRPGIPMMASIIGLLFNIILNIIFIPKWGIAGASFASSISYTVDTLILLLFYQKISHNSFLSAVIVRLSDFSYYKSLTFHNINK